MVVGKRHVLFGLLLLALVLFQSGCVVQAPPSSDTSRDLSRLFAVAEKVHARAGVYLNEDMRGYVYKQEKAPAPFQMETGRNIRPVVMTMASAMFDNAIEVDSLPPYTGGYRPDVEVVIEPELTYTYGATSGVMSGQLTAVVKLRVKAYDLSGRIIWQGEALGENQGEQVDVLSTLLGNVDKSAKAAGQAGLNAAVKIIKEFNVSKPPELYSLLEQKASAQAKGQKRSGGGDEAEKLFQRGMYQYDKKNFQQAIYSFQQADRLKPDDLSNRFYLGVCQMYTGQKRRAVDTLNYVLTNSKKGDSLAANSRQWIQRLNDPLKISIVFSGYNGRIAGDVRQGFLNSLTNCGMYDVISVQDTEGPVAQSAMKKYIDEAARKKARIVLFVQSEKNVKDLTDPTLREGDIASEFALNTNVKAYSAQKKKPVSDFILFDNAARMKKQANAELIQTGLLQRSANRTVLSLLGNEIF